MRKNRTWHGIDASNETSLFEYGFLIRWESKHRMYKVIYQTFIGKGVALYTYDFWDANDWRKMLKDGEYDLESIADMCGIDSETYLDETSDVNLLNDLLMYYGASELGFGDYRTPHTEQYIRQKLNRALH